MGLCGGEEGEEDAGELFFEVHCRKAGEAQEMVLAYRSEKVDGWVVFGTVLLGGGRACSAWGSCLWMSCHAMP